MAVGLLQVYKQVAPQALLRCAIEIEDVSGVTNNE